MDVFVVRPELEGVVAWGEVVCPTDEDVTCSIEAADDVKCATQSAVVGDSSGLVACGLK